MAKSPIDITGKDLQSLSYMLIEAMRKIAATDTSIVGAATHMSDIAKDAIKRSGNDHLIK